MVNVCLISDFFFPNIGGVESHIYYVAYCLKELGHKVIVLTINRPNINLTGIRYISNGIKVYYLPCMVQRLANGYIIFPTQTGLLILLIRNILIREEIDLVHGHQGTSTLGMVGLWTANSMNIPYIMTEHSLFDFDDKAAIHLNNLYEIYSSICISKIICVSNTVRENFILRTNVGIEKTCVIPNALDSTIFRKKTVGPKLLKKPNTVRIVVLSRMTFRKGMDLLMELLPVICKKYKNVEFLICGDGEKKSMILNLVKEFKIENQVKFLGFTKIERVPEILSSGDIFLNPSVSEAFCIAILEAAACGAYVLTTNVGGISEILPHDFLTLSNPTSEDLIRNLCKILDEKIYLKKQNYNEFISEYYNWHRVAAQTLEVYIEVLKNYKKKSIFEMVSKTLIWRPSFLFVILLLLLNKLIIFIYSLFFPTHKIQKAKNVPNNKF
jgi:phosphatidylinositol glycan class A protein